MLGLGVVVLRVHPIPSEMAASLLHTGPLTSVDGPTNIGDHMKIKAKRKDLMNMLNGLPQAGNLKGFKLAYAIARNKRALEQEQSALHAGLNPSDDYREYDTKRIKLAKEYADKDENGRYKKAGGRFVGLGANPKWDAVLEALQEECKEAIDAYNKQNKDYEAALEEEIEFDMFMVSPEEVPPDVTVNQFDGLYLMIREPDGVIERAEPERPKPEQ